MSQGTVKWGNVGIAFAVVAVIALIFIIGAINAPPSSPSSAASQEASNQCEDDWSKCTDNEQLVNHYSGWTKVQAYCKVEAENEARYGTPVWPWIPFGSYSRGDDYVKSGVAVAIEPDAQFQNGFGAMAHSTVTCRYDLRNDRVLSVSVEPH
jgi:hypothetical protein